MISAKYDVINIENPFKYKKYIDVDNRKLYIQKAKNLLKQKLYYKFIQDSNTLCLYPYKKIIDGNEYLLPCGKCFYCRTRRSSEWQQRIQNEITAWDGNVKYNLILFITLTYNDLSLSKRLDTKSIDKMFEGVYFDDDNIKIDLYNNIIQKRFKRDFKLFNDKLRRFFKNRNYRKYKYFAAFEYGNLHDREHFHLILFIQDKIVSDDYEVLKKKIEKYWGLGFVNIRNVYDYKGVSKYVSKYIMKGSIKLEYGLLDKGKLFSLKSRRLGWDGYYYLLKNKMYDKIKTIPRALYLNVKESNPDIYVDFNSNVSIRNKKRLLEKALINMDLDINGDFDSSMVVVAFNKYVDLFNNELKNKRRLYFLKQYVKYKV